jgi:hypothetical protein
MALSLATADITPPDTIHPLGVGGPISEDWRTEHVAG